MPPPGGSWGRGWEVHRWPGGDRGWRWGGGRWEFWKYRVRVVGRDGVKKNMVTEGGDGVSEIFSS
jgi:hypothetical protein